MNTNIFAYRRQRILNYQNMFEKFVEKLKKEYANKISIILFGSRGRGDNMESSDFDVLIILENKTNRDYQIIYQLKPAELPVDAVIITPDELQNPVIKKMIMGSKVIYDGLILFHNK